MVNITRFKPKKHMEVLVDMHRSQEYKDMYAIGLETLPKIGFISFSNTEFQYIAAGFLRIVEGGFGQLDTFVTNPSLDSHVRDEGLNLLVETLINEAKTLKLKGIYAHTASINIIKRAEETGFHVINQSIIALKL